MPDIQKNGKKVDLEILRGSTFKWFVTLKSGELPRNYTQDDLDKLTPIDISQKEVVLKIQPIGCDAQGTQYPALSFDKSTDVVDTPVGEVGVIRLKILSDMSLNAFDWSDASYKVVVQDTPTDVTIPVFGMISILTP